MRILWPLHYEVVTGKQTLIYRLTLGLWIILWTRKETGFPALRMASTASSWLASLRFTPSTWRKHKKKKILAIYFKHLSTLVQTNKLHRLFCDTKSPFTSTIRSPVFRVPFCPAGLSSRMCLIKMPRITSPELSRLPIPRPPTILIPRDLPGSRKSSTLRKVPIRDCKSFHFKPCDIWYVYKIESKGQVHMCMCLCSHTSSVGSRCYKMRFLLLLRLRARGGWEFL